MGRLNNFNYSRKQLLIIILIAYSIVTIFIATIILFSSNNDQNIKIGNENILKNKGGMKQNDLLVLRKAIRNVSTAYYNIPQQNAIDSTIRESTYIKSETNNTFIIDIETLQSTYTVTMPHSLDRTSDISLSCVNTKLSKWPNVFCKGTNNNTTIDANLDPYLPLISYYPDNSYKYTVKHEPYTNNLTVSLFIGCEDKKTKDELMQEIKKWIRDKDVDPEIIQFNYDESACLAYRDYNSHGGHTKH